MIPLGTLIYIFTMLPFTVIGMLIVSSKIADYLSSTNHNKRHRHRHHSKEEGWDREL